MGIKDDERVAVVVVIMTMMKKQMRMAQGRRLVSGNIYEGECIFGNEGSLPVLPPRLERETQEQTDHTRSDYSAQ